MNRLEKREFYRKEFIQKAKELHNNKYDYSNVIYVNSRTKVKIICPNHGEFEQIPSSHIQGNGCPKCAAEWTDTHKKNHAKSLRKLRGMTTEEWIARAKAIHGDKYDYSQTVYANQKTKVTIICPVHGAFVQNPDSHIRGCGCRQCGYNPSNHIGSHYWSEEQRAKTEATCLQRYGARRYLDSEEGRKRNKEIRSDCNFREKMRKIISSNDVQEKTRNTCMERYGVPSAMSLQKTVDKVAKSKILNHTWTSSKPEEKMYVILNDFFGESNVIRQYKESRYPFRCDFYIKPFDLFIEFNGTWLHGGKWFNIDDSDCLAKLDKWRSRLEKGHDFYKEAIYTWTVRDAKKRETAISNKLNYLAFWKNDLSDFMEWLESDELKLSNIL